MNAGRDDRGESLIELLMSLVIISIALFTIFEGIRLSIWGSDVHRQQTGASVFLRDYAETIENTVATGGYAAGTGTYPAYVPTDTNYSASVVSKLCGTGTTWGSCSTTPDSGVQQLTLQVASKDGRASEQLTIIVRKPCGPGSSC